MKESPEIKISLWLKLKIKFSTQIFHGSKKAWQKLISQRKWWYPKYEWIEDPTQWLLTSKK